MKYKTFLIFNQKIDIFFSMSVHNLWVNESSSPRKDLHMNLSSASMKLFKQFEKNLCCHDLLNFFHPWLLMHSPSILSLSLRNPVVLSSLAYSKKNSLKLKQLPTFATEASSSCPSHTCNSSPACPFAEMPAVSSLDRTVETAFFCSFFFNNYSVHDPFLSAFPNRVF